MNFLFLALFSILLKVTFGVLTFNEDTSVVINQCMTFSGDSVIYRCSDDSIWRLLYTGSSTCNGIATAEILAGCDDDSYIYKIENCTSAKENSNGNCNYFATDVFSNDNTLQGIPTDVCMNSGTSSSAMIHCINNEPYYYTYNRADCEGTVFQNFSYANVGTYHCGGSDCQATARVYTVGSSDVCNYESSNYDAPGSSDCNYFVTGNGGIPVATGKCFSARTGDYEYSSRYECHQDSGSSSYKVLLYKWLDSDSCSGDDNKYLVSNYTSANYTIHCGYSNCGNNVRTYDDCENTLDNHRPTYSEVPYAMNQCIRYYTSPLNSDSVNNTSPYEDQYYMMACIDGYVGTYYYLDSECEQMNTFTVTNTSTFTCPVVVEGCTSSANMINMMNSILFVFSLLFLHNFF